MTTSEIVPATAVEARELTDRIKVAVDGTWQLIKHAYVSRAWSALGYSSWDDYCTQEFGTSRLRLPREERQEVVSSMREIGMSTRAITAATGIDRKTVRRDLQVGEMGPPESPEFYEDDEPSEDVRHAFDQGEKSVTREPERVTGTDGKSYAAQPGRTPNRPALPPQFGTVAGELFRLSSRVERLRGDDRYRSNRTSISDECVPQIRRTVEVLTDLLDDLASEN